MLPAEIAEERPDLAIHVGPETAFFTPGWHELPRIYEAVDAIDPRTRIQHLWQHIARDDYFSWSPGWTGQGRTPIRCTESCS